ncbi:MAG: methyltransferase domain-containing protein [Blastocatellia bacterium]|nr:methyltransferase domain-containing protein [Blastocatellia bacterium]
MSKTDKELAFIRDLFVDEAWTQRFTELVDKHINLKDAENMAYLNAGTGNHAMALAEKFGEITDIFASVETDELLTIARDKAAATSSRADFSRIKFEDDSFDSVLADASLVPVSEITDVIDDAIRVAKVGGDVGVVLPTAGSFGEVFSLLWEALYNEDLNSHGEHIERLIAELPSVTRVEELAAQAGLVNVNTEVAVELFEYDSGTDFVESPLIADYFLPHWLESLDENEKERVVKQLTHLIDAEEAPVTFRFSVKATLLSGEKG